MRILVIEDEEGISRFLKAGLESEYFAVDVADDGESSTRRLLETLLQITFRSSTTMVLKRTFPEERL
jgi:DNA-binding response OmpR family regulator